MSASSVASRYYSTSSSFDLAQGLGGVAAVTLVFGALALTGVVYGAVTGRSILSVRAHASSPPPVNEAPQVVEAGFVQLGRAWDPRALPDRRIASEATAPRAQSPDVVSPFQRLLPDAGVPRPTNEALTSLLDSSATYDQDGRSEHLYEQAGETWGAERAQSGNMLLGQLDTLIRRGLNVPGSIPASEYATTVAGVRVVVDENWVVSSIQLVRESGNEDWDRAVRRRVDEIAGSSPRLQPTPQDAASLNQPITLHVKPRSARGSRPAAAAPTPSASGASSGSPSAFDRLLQ